MDLDKIKHLQVADFIEFAPIMSLSIYEAVPRVKEFCRRKEVPENEFKNIGMVVRALGLYT